MQRIAIALAAVVIALLVVGPVTGLIFRHIVQVLPAALLLLIFRRRSWFAYGALPVSLIWFVLMVLAWLWIVFRIPILTGTFTPIEIVLTIIIGGAALAGILFTLIERPRTSAGAGIAAFVVMLALQVGALWLSFQPYLANRCRVSVY